MKPKVSNWILVTAMFALLLGACAVDAPAMQLGERGIYIDDYAEAPMAVAPAAMEGSAAMDMGGSIANTAVIAASAERLVIKNASLSIVVDDPVASMKAIAALAEAFDGFVVDSYMYQRMLSSGIEAPGANITIRVPAERLQEALERIEQDARTVLNRNESGQDVTAQYTDLQSRLRNLQDAEVMLRQIMQDATESEDVLAAFNQLNAITEQIEVLKGQIRYYEESAALSAISVELIASQAVQPITIGGWEPVGVAKDAIQALVNALQGIVDALIWALLYLLPVALVIGLPIWLLVRALRGRRKPASKATKKRK